MNSKQQGDVGVAMAIAYYTKEGFGVSVPLTDNLRYDLIVDDGGKLLRVQVKSTRFQRNNRYVVQLATSGGNQSWSKESKRISALESDEVFIYAFSGEMWKIPTIMLDGFSASNLGPSKDQYRVTF